MPLPPDVGFDDAAALLVQGLTAHYLVHDQRSIGAGDVVLVHAAAGGTGLLVVAWLKHLGATVIGTVSSAAKAGVAAAAGADHVVDYTAQDFVAEARRITGRRGVDYVIDGVGKSTFAGDLEVVRTRGHICLFGRASGFPDPVQPFALVPKSITLRVATWSTTSAIALRCSRRPTPCGRGSVKGGCGSLRTISACSSTSSVLKHAENRESAEVA